MAESRNGGAIHEHGALDTQADALTFNTKCHICHYKGKEVQAANLCLECNHLYICKGCTVTHAKTKATKAHVVVPLKTKQIENTNEEVCAKHRSLLTSYCTECEEPACKICLQLDHADHEVEQLSDRIHTKVKEVQVMSSKREQELKEMKILKAELMGLRSSATPSIDGPKQDILIKEIEDHTEKCIEKLIRLKEELKAKVKETFSAIKDVVANLDIKLETVNESINKLNTSLQQATKLLSETKIHTSYLDKVAFLQKDLDAITCPCDPTDGKKFHDRIHKLQQSSTSFIPEEPSTIAGIGTLKEVLSKDQPLPKRIAQHTLETDSKDKFIPCLANLGDKFAAAHPTKKGQPSDGVDIYEFPNSLKLTLTGAVGPVHDLASTPHGQLAVLSDGSTGTSNCSVKIFDPNTGKNIITHNLDIARPMSLGVNFQNQYVILSGKGWGSAQITIVNGDGSVELTQVINVLDLSDKNPGRLACGWKYIYIVTQGHKWVKVYEVQGNKLVHVSTISEAICKAKDISATIWGHLFLADQLPSSKNIYMMRFIPKDQRNGWDCKYEVACKGELQTTEADKECRISARGSFTVMSWGQTISVYSS